MQEPLEKCLMTEMLYRKNKLITLTEDKHVRVPIRSVLALNYNLAQQKPVKADQARIVVYSLSSTYMFPSEV